MYTILWICYDGIWEFYDYKIYKSLEEVQAKFDEIIHNPRYGGEVFKIAKLVPV